MSNSEKRQRKPIKQWAEDQRPREKLLKHGSHTLSNAELIAILIGSGTSEHSAVELAQLMLDKANHDLHLLSRFSPRELDEFKGIGFAKAIQLKAAFELGIRLTKHMFLNRQAVRPYSSTQKQNPSLSTHLSSPQGTDSIETQTGKKQMSIRNSQDVYNYILDTFIFESTEKFVVLLLNAKNNVLGVETVSSGGYTHTYVDIKKILKTALEHKAVRIIVCHNHPSGDPTPSDSDIDMTKKISNAAQQIDLELLDHIIFGKETYYSFADNGKI